MAGFASAEVATFAVGDIVDHPLFGAGPVEEIRETGYKTALRVSFPDRPGLWLRAVFTPLEVSETALMAEFKAWREKLFAPGGPRTPRLAMARSATESVERLKTERLLVRALGRSTWPEQKRRQGTKLDGGACTAWALSWSDQPLCRSHAARTDQELNNRRAFAWWCITSGHAEEVADFRSPPPKKYPEDPLPSHPSSPEGAQPTGKQPWHKLRQFHVGDLVEHVNYGHGVVVETEGEGRDHEVEVVFDSGESKRLVAFLAPMEEVGKVAVPEAEPTRPLGSVGEQGPGQDVPAPMAGDGAAPDWVEQMVAGLIAAGPQITPVKTMCGLLHTTLGVDERLVFTCLKALAAEQILTVNTRVVAINTSVLSRHKGRAVVVVHGALARRPGGASRS